MGNQKSSSEQLPTQGEMDYKTYYKLSNEYKELLNEYSLTNDCVNGTYYMAKVFLDEMNNKAYLHSDYLQVAGEWLYKGGTILLKDALGFLNFKEDRLSHFNAMCLMDAVSCKAIKKSEL